MSATRNKFSPEFRDRAVRMVEEHRGDRGGLAKLNSAISGFSV
jgi:transposase-like protein